MIGVGVLLATLLAGRLAIVSSASLANGQAALRYADVDGERVAEVLRELGGFEGVWRLRQPTVSEMRSTLERVREVARRDKELELVFYYSGHSDESGLLLGPERLAYAELRELLEKSGAAIRVALLDGCNSGGAITRKGGRPSPGFSLAVLAPSRVRGAAIITASASTEAAQESSSLGGSFFTYHLLSALRGAGDRNENGQVTLAEAYQYAYSHTLATTVASAFGPQHPSYEYSLAGAGDLVLTDVRTTGSAMYLADSSLGSYLITTDDEVLAEVTVPAGKPVQVALRPGRYRVTLREGGRAFAEDFSLEQGQSLVVQRRALHEVSEALAMGKGTGPAHPYEVIAGYRMSALPWSPLRTRGAVAAGVLRHGRRSSMGLHLAYESFEQMTHGTEWVHYDLYKLSLTGQLFRRFELKALGVELGAEGGATFIIQESARAGFTSRQVAPLLAATAALVSPAVGSFTLRLLCRAGTHLMKYPLEVARPLAEATVGLAAGMLF